MEQIIYNIDMHVDITFGTSDATYTDTKGRVHSLLTNRLMTKYGIIFQVAENLPVDIKQVKNFILQSSGAAMTDISLLIDIPDWMALLTTEFTNKGILSDYTSSIVPASKKKLAINGAEIKDKSLGENEVTAQWKKTKKHFIVDEKFKKTLKKIAEEKAKESANKELEIYKNPDIMEACRKEGHRVCWECASMNCLIKQLICKKLNKPKQFLGSCTGKPAKFGDLSKYGLEFIPKGKGTKPEPANTASTVIKTSEEIDSDSNNSDVERAMGGFLSMRTDAINNVNEDASFGFNANPVNMSTEEPSNGDF